MIDGTAVARILRDHLNECLAQQHSIFTSDDEAIHDFRLSCKRLRFAIERFDLPDVQPMAKALSQITDELGSAHDSVVLAKRARKLHADAVAWRALQDRSRFMKRARVLWINLAPQLNSRIA